MDSPAEAPRESTLKFPNQDPRGDEPATWTMRRIDDPGYGVELVARTITRIHGGHSTVYRATVDRLGDDPCTADVVCKVVTGRRNIDRLKHEAEIYHDLEELQGIYVPKCVGLFQGELEDGLSACLMTLYCGPTLDKDISYTSWDFRTRVVRALAEIHEYGVEHGDFRESNIVVGSDGKPYIIDFDRAKVHQCPRSIPIKPRGIEPAIADFDCKELWWACYNAEIWRPRKIRYLHQYWPVQNIGSVEELANFAPKGVSRQEALEKAVLAIDAYLKEVDRRWQGAQ